MIAIHESGMTLTSHIRLNDRTAFIQSEPIKANFIDGKRQTHNFFSFAPVQMRIRKSTAH